MDPTAQSGDWATLLSSKSPRRLKDSAEEFANEQMTFRLLGQKSPYLITCFFTAPGAATFMLRAANDLKAVILARSYVYNQQVGLRWMGQICGGATFLEPQSLAHGDLRPDNILVDQHGNLRIHDLGSALAIGDFLPTGTEPFARMLIKIEGRGYGQAGAITENFAIGSTIYSIKRGHYPYADEKNRQNLRNMLKNKQFPPLTDSVEDGIISTCWEGGYRSVAELEQAIRDMGGGTEWYSFDVEDKEWIKERKDECTAWVEAGGLKNLPPL